jgi:hypothetical protein
MSEHEIRKIIRSVCADLDQRAKRAAQATARCVVLPTVMGLSLTVAGCDEDELKQPGGDLLADDATAENGGAAGSGQGGKGGVAGSAQAVGGASGSGTKRDAGVIAVYSAPLDAGVKDSGPMVKYMAPIDSGAKADSGTKTDSGAKVDASIQPLYMAQIDSGAQAEYAAPLPDGGPMVKYMAQFPDSGPMLLYRAPDPK